MEEQQPTKRAKYADGIGTPISIDNIREASERISKFIHKTPILTSSSISSMVEGDRTLFFKCELFQKTGSFKIRGALNAVLSLDDGVTSVVTHSSGNHAQALAYAAKVKGIAAHIVMPEDAPQVKVNAVKGYGADVTFVECKPGAREEATKKVIEEQGSHFVHPSNEPKVICGQGTVGLEMVEQIKEMSGGELDAIIIPIGGGGLCSGVAAAAKALNPNITVIAAEPLNADDAFRSKETGTITQHDVVPNTIADGLKTTLGSNTWPIVRDLVNEIITVTEEDIQKAMRVVYERLKVVIEPSAAVGVAVVLSDAFAKKPEYESLKTIGIVLCGGNVNLDLFQSFLL
mmetsp:Transcript_12467/g.16353  ORF Transcript_12467/g.16353 Transcript_12467/m.16353 type:complete len:345 (+) Transcript_12467:105-1139(+)